MGRLWMSTSEFLELKRETLDLVYLTWLEYKTLVLQDFQPLWLIRITPSRFEGMEVSQNDVFWTVSAFGMIIRRVKNTEPHNMSYPVREGWPQYGSTSLELGTYWRRGDA